MHSRARPTRALRTIRAAPRCPNPVLGLDPLMTLVTLVLLLVTSVTLMVTERTGTPIASERLAEANVCFTLERGVGELVVACWMTMLTLHSEAEVLMVSTSRTRPTETFARLARSDCSSVLRKRAEHGLEAVRLTWTAGACPGASGG